MCRGDAEIKAYVVKLPIFAMFRIPLQMWRDVGGALSPTAGVQRKVCFRKVIKMFAGPL